MSKSGGGDLIGARDHSPETVETGDEKVVEEEEPTVGVEEMRGRG
jgi:hypothetical protein